MTTRIEQFSQAFTTRKRDDGDEFTSLDKSAPDWMTDVVREAHGDMMPDDWRYKMISECADALVDVDPSDWQDQDFEICDGLVDVYNSTLLDWLSSHGQRAAYIDEARDEGLLAEDADEMNRIMVGQFMEYREILGSLMAEFIDDEDEDDEDEDDEELEDEEDEDGDDDDAPQNPVAAPLGNAFAPGTPSIRDYLRTKS